MELQTVEIPRAEARESYLEYRRTAERTADPVARRELEEMAAAFRQAARENVSLIALSSTIARGGTMPRTLTYGRGSDHERREEFLLPRLAVCRSDARFAFTLGIERDGVIEFVAKIDPAWTNRRDRLRVEAGFELPDGYEPGRRLGPAWSPKAWSSMVPIVPPKHRPAGSSTLGSYVTLWEVDEWAWSSVPPPPGDPALLKHVGGDVYVVMATWDLTELEKLVLSGRRFD